MLTEFFRHLSVSASCYELRCWQSWFSAVSSRLLRRSLGVFDALFWHSSSTVFSGLLRWFTAVLGRPGPKSGNYERASVCLLAFTESLSRHHPTLRVLTLLHPSLPVYTETSSCLPCLVVISKPYSTLRPCLPELARLRPCSPDLARLRPCLPDLAVSSRACPTSPVRVCACLISPVFGCLNRSRPW